MASVKVKQEYPETQAKECYQACLVALRAGGYSFFKQRDYAWFAIATRRVEGQDVTCNMLTSLGPPTSIELNLTAARLEDAALQQLAQEILDATAQALA